MKNLKKIKINIPKILKNFNNYIQILCRFHKIQLQQMKYKKLNMNI